MQTQILWPLLAQVAPLIAGSGMYTLDAIEFRADTLELTLRTRDVAALAGALPVTASARAAASASRFCNCSSPGSKTRP